MFMFALQLWLWLGVQCLDEVQDAELALVGVHTEHKVESSVMAVDEPPVPPTQLAAGEGEGG